MKFSKCEIEIYIAVTSCFIRKDTRLERKRTIYVKLWETVSFQYLNIKEIIKHFRIVDQLYLMFGDNIKI